ncbi:unnamed protein product [Amoebophrya sp. A25]|nr:unnamed protein product [Amoebophrya sp. A25]|eukprot:GSA25T00008346001.1
MDTNGAPAPTRSISYAHAEGSATLVVSLRKNPDSTTEATSTSSTPMWTCLQAVYDMWQVRMRLTIRRWTALFLTDDDEVLATSPMCRKMFQLALGQPLGTIQRLGKRVKSSDGAGGAGDLFWIMYDRNADGNSVIDEDRQRKFIPEPTEEVSLSSSPFVRFARVFLQMPNTPKSLVELTAAFQGPAGDHGVSIIRSSATGEPVGACLVENDASSSSREVVFADGFSPLPASGMRDAFYWRMNVDNFILDRLTDPEPRRGDREEEPVPEASIFERYQVVLVTEGKFDSVAPIRPKAGMRQDESANNKPPAPLTTNKGVVLKFRLSASAVNALHSVITTHLDHLHKDTDTFFMAESKPRLVEFPPRENEGDDEIKDKAQQDFESHVRLFSRCTVLVSPVSDVLTNAIFLPEHAIVMVLLPSVPSLDRGYMIGWGTSGNMNIMQEDHSHTHEQWPPFTPKTNKSLRTVAAMDRSPFFTFLHANNVAPVRFRGLVLNEEESSTTALSGEGDVGDKKDNQEVDKEFVFDIDGSAFARDFALSYSQASSYLTLNAWQMEHFGRFLIDRPAPTPQNATDSSTSPVAHVREYRAYITSSKNKDKKPLSDTELGRFTYIDFPTLLAKEKALQQLVSTQRSYVWEREVMRRVDLETIAQDVSNKLQMEIRQIEKSLFEL